MSLLLKRFLVIGVAFGVALFSQHFLQAWQWLNIIPWAMMSVIVGFISMTRKDAIYNGAFFGYFLSLSYLFSDYSGKEDVTSIIRLIAVVLLISLVGAIGGAFWAILGNVIKRKLANKNMVTDKKLHNENCHQQVHC